MNGAPPYTPVVLYTWTVSTPEPTTAARAALRQALAGLDLCGEIIDDAVLAVSEVVANASVHATGPYELRIRRTAAEIVCEVQDSDSWIPKVPFLPAAAPFAPKAEDRGNGLDALQKVLAERGRGLQIVDHLSRGSWGFRCTPLKGKVAWFAIPLRWSTDGFSAGEVGSAGESFGGVSSPSCEEDALAGYEASRPSCSKP